MSLWGLEGRGGSVRVRHGLFHGVMMGCNNACGHVRERAAMQQGRAPFEPGMLQNKHSLALMPHYIESSHGRPSI